MRNIKFFIFLVPIWLEKPCWHEKHNVFYLSLARLGNLCNIITSPVIKLFLRFVVDVKTKFMTILWVCSSKSSQTWNKPWNVNNFLIVRVMEGIGINFCLGIRIWLPSRKIIKSWWEGSFKCKTFEFWVYDES